MRTLREFRYLTRSYNMERDRMLRYVRMLSGVAVSALGMALLGFNETRAYLDPWVPSILILFGLFFVLTSRSKSLSRREVRFLPIPPQLLGYARGAGKYSHFRFMTDDADPRKWYANSSRVDQGLMEVPLSVRMLPKPYALPSEVRRLAPHILRMMTVPPGDRLFARNLALASDLVESTFADNDKVSVRPADYASGLCSNEMTLWSAVSRRDDSVILDGMDLLSNGRIIRTIEEGACANIVGVSSALFLADGHYMVRRQGKKYADNFGELVPFTSVSLSVADYHPSRTLQGTAAGCVSREVGILLGAEIAARSRTSVVGYGRILARGGKPELLCVTVIDATISELFGSGRVPAGVEVPYPYRTSGRLSVSSIADGIRGFAAEHAEESSVQQAMVSNAVLRAAANPNAARILSSGLRI